MIDNKKVGGAIAALRQEKGYTQQQLAAALNVSHQAVSKWENGQAIPDVETLMALSRLFGVTVDRLLEGDVPGAEAEKECPAGDIADKISEAVDDITKKFEMAVDPKFRGEDGAELDVEQLIQAAPFMSKAAIEKELSAPGVTLRADQIRRLAPFVSAETLEALIEKSEIRIEWDFVTRVAPFLKREVVDRLVAAAREGHAYIKPAIDPIGKALDDIGRTISSTVSGAAKSVGEFVSQIFSTGEESAPVSERALELRRKALEKALEAGNWDWIEQHLSDADEELLSRIADTAVAAGKKEWVCEHIPSYANCELTLTALEQGNWDWLGLMAKELTGDGRRQVLDRAVAEGRWDWLYEHAADIDMSECAGTVIPAAIDAEQRGVASLVAQLYATSEQVSSACSRALFRGDMELLDSLLELADEDCVNGILESLADADRWQDVCRLCAHAGQQEIASLTERAIELGKWDAIDELTKNID